MSTGGQRRSVVVTGMGLLSPLGGQEGELLQALRSGASGVTYMPNQAWHELPTHHMGVVQPSFWSDRWIDPALSQAPLSLRALSYVTCQAMEQSGLSIDSLPYCPEEMGCIIGLDYVRFDLLKNLPFLRGECRRLSDEFTLFPQSALPLLRALYPFGGHHFFHLGACSASSQAIGEGMRQIASGRQRCMLVGGISFERSLYFLLELHQIGVLAKTVADPHLISKPFDQHRYGITLGEGAVVLLLEEQEAACKRGACPLAQVRGYGCALDGYSLSSPHKEGLGMKLAMRRALQDAGCTPEQLDYINAHGTGTVPNDWKESEAIASLFTDRRQIPPISSTKSMHGHLMATSGALEAVICLLALREQFIPPTINYTTPDPLCSLDYTPNRARSASLSLVLSNSFGMGGTNSTLIFAHPDAPP